MRRLRKGFAFVCFSLMLASCSSDPATLVKTNEVARTQIMTAIAADSALTASMAEALLNEDRASEVLVAKVAANGKAMQMMMATLARDPAAIDGIIGFAVQESTMKEHVLTLLKGIQIAEGVR